MKQVKDVIIIGAGTAGLTALREVRKRTDNFLLINDGAYGTTCARVGCMPSKALIEAANTFHRRRAFEAFGIRGGEGLIVDLPFVLRRVRKLRDDFVSRVLKATESLGERNLAGRARLLGPHQVDVDGRRFHARSIIIATGSRPVVPDSWRSFGNRILTTDTLFEQEALPRRIAVIGLGPIGVELSQALSRLGIQIVGFDAGRMLAGMSDESVHAAFAELLGQELAFYMEDAASLSETPDGIEIRSGQTRVLVDRVIAAMGRRPNIDGIGMETLGVELDSRGMPPVDSATMQIADLPVFLAGDANGHAAILHEAADEGHIAGFNAMAEHVQCFKRRIPLGIIFSDPGIARVGQRFSELNPASTLIGGVRFAGHGRARTAERNKGMMRIYASRENGRLLGAEMCVPAAEHMAQLLALAIECQLTVGELLRMPFYHPVFEEGVRAALKKIASQLPSDRMPDLAVCDSIQSETLD